MKLPLKKDIFKSPIGRKLIFVIFAFSSLITLVTTAIQLSMDYRRDLSNIQEAIEDIHLGQLDTFSHILWNLDEETIQILLNSLLKIDGIEHLKVTSDQKTYWEAGRVRSKHIISNVFPIYHLSNKDVFIGDLEVVAGLDAVYRRLFEKALVILAGNTVKTFLVVILALAAFQRMVTRHLIRLADYARNFAPERSTGDIKLDRRQKDAAPPDELDIVVSAYNSMQARLNEEIQKYKALEKEKEISGRLFTYYVDGINADVFIKDGDGCYTFLNRHAEGRFKVDRKELGRKKYTDFHFFDRETAEQNLINERRIIETGAQVESEEYVRTDAQNSEPSQPHYSYYLSLRFPLRDLGGNIVGICGFSHDITRQKAIENALRESEERFRLALENIPDVIVIYGTDLRIRYINTATQRVTGRSISDFIGKRDDEIWPPEVCEVYLPTLREALHTRSVLSVEANLALADERYLAITCVPLLNEKGEVREILGITHDLTESKHAEQELKQHRDNLEKRIDDRTSELRKLVSLMSDREIKMMELKKENAQLKAKGNNID